MSQDRTRAGLALPSDGFTDILSRPSLRPRLVAGRDRCRSARLRVLHVPRQSGPGPWIEPPSIAGGMLFLNAGYGDHAGRAGNVLLALEVQ